MANVRYPRRYRLWTTAIPECYDGLGDPVQMGGDLTPVSAGEVDWLLYGSTAPVHPALNDLVLHNGVPWQVNIDVTDAQEGAGPFVRYWDGGAWVDAGFPANWHQSNFYTRPFGCSIVSDGESIFVGFEAMHWGCLALDASHNRASPGDCGCVAVTCDTVEAILMGQYRFNAHAPQVWKYDGSWTQVGAWDPWPTSPCPTTDGFQFNYGCSLGFRANLGWAETIYGWDDPCPDDVLLLLEPSPPRLLLAAKDGDFIAVWWEVYEDRLVAKDTVSIWDEAHQIYRCVMGEDTETTAGSWMGALYSGGSRTAYADAASFDSGNGERPVDIVWDGDTPLVLHYTGAIGHTLEVRDATDGTVLQTIASKNPKARFSVPFSGLRYVSGIDASGGPGDASLWQMPSDASGPFDDLDGDAQYTPVFPNTAVGKPHPEVNNIWLPNADSEYISQFDRRCPLSIPPKRWRSTAARVPPATVGSALSYESYRSEANSNYIFAIIVKTSLVADPTHQVWRVPITRCTETCEPAPSVVYVRIDGVEEGPLVLDGMPSGLTQIRVGGGFGGGVGNQFFDDVKVGTTGWQSSDVFSADFASAIVPPFDSTSGVGLSLSGGTLQVDNSSFSYAQKAVSITGNFYVSLKLKIDGTMWDAGGFTNYLLRLYDGVSSFFDLQVDMDAPEFVMDTVTYPTGDPLRDTWQTIDFHFVL